MNTEIKITKESKNPVLKVNARTLPGIKQSDRKKSSQYIYSNMNRKQMAQFKRMIKHDQYHRFMNALEITLNKIAA